jgi:hypothetical protein
MARLMEGCDPALTNFMGIKLASNSTCLPIIQSLM